LKKLQETRRANHQGRQRILQELRRLAGPQAAQAAQGDDNAIRQQIKALRDHEERTVAEVRKAYEALDEVLDAKQQARFRLFEERLELRKMDLLMRARQGAARRESR
jgi:RNA-splicing ligase RtcB